MTIGDKLKDAAADVKKAAEEAGEKIAEGAGDVKDKVQDAAADAKKKIEEGKEKKQ